jgi:hypothetical protein
VPPDAVAGAFFIVLAVAFGAGLVGGVILSAIVATWLRNSPSLPEELRREFFRPDLLQFRHTRYNLLVDIGWYPHSDLATGEYGLVLHEGDFRPDCCPSSVRGPGWRSSPSWSVSCPRCRRPA